MWGYDVFHPTTEDGREKKRFLEELYAERQFYVATETTEPEILKFAYNGPSYSKKFSKAELFLINDYEALEIADATRLNVIRRGRKPWVDDPDEPRRRVEWSDEESEYTMDEEEEDEEDDDDEDNGRPEMAAPWAAAAVRVERDNHNDIPRLPPRQLVRL